MTVKLEIPFACTVIPYQEWYRATDVWFGCVGYDTTPEFAAGQCEIEFNSTLRQLSNLSPDALTALLRHHRVPHVLLDTDSGRTLLSDNGI